MNSRSRSLLMLLILLAGALILPSAWATPASLTVRSIAPAGPGDGAGKLTLLHNNDGESSLLPIKYTVRTVTTTVQLDVGSVAAYKTLTDQNIAQAHSAGNAVVNVYAGDAFLASATLACSLPPNPPATPVYDAIAQKQIPYTAHIFGNHEFDYSPDFLKRFIDAFEGAQPFLSANLDFSGEPAYTSLIDADGLIDGAPQGGRVIGRSMIYTDTTTNQRFGIVGATTPTLPTISTPRNVTVTATLTETAVVVQAEIDRLLGLGVRKIIFVSHLQDVDNDRALIRRLANVDVAVAGGGDELLASTSVPTTTQLLPGEQAPIEGTYPLTETDALNRTVYIVTTAGNYKYLGRLDVTFDAQGEVASIDTTTSYPRRVIPKSPVATQLGLADAVDPDAGIVSSVNQPVQGCLDTLASTPVARSEVVLDVSRNGVRGRETNAGNLIADSFVAAYDRYADNSGLPPRGPDNRVIGVQNGGGIRQNAGDILPVGGAPGVISRLNTIDVLPFDNFVTVVQNVTPSDLKTILERSAASLPGTGGQFLQVSGITVTLNLTFPVGSRVREVSLSDGTPMIRDGTVVAGAPSIAIVTNSFTANGGDNYPTFANNPNKVRLLDDSGIAISYEQAWREYLQSFPVKEGLPTIAATDRRYQPGGEGRIRILAVRAYMPILAR
jgi:5'-nucleotidase